MSEQIIVTPSKLHQFAFCPRQVWFDYYLQVKRPLIQRLRMFVGKALHIVHHLFRVGYEKEKLLEVDVPDLNIRLVGKPDAFADIGDVIHIEEFKSTKQPRSLNRWGLQVWESDMVQSLAYAYILFKLYGKIVMITVRYVDGSVTFQYDEKLEAVLFMYLKQYRDMIDTKVFPDVSRGRKCDRCVYRDICNYIDSESKKLIEGV